MTEPRGSDDDSPICVDVVRALAKVEDARPSDLDFVLNDHIHTDALDLMSRNGHGSWELSFKALDHEVTVDSDQTITIDGEVIEVGP